MDAHSFKHHKPNKKGLTPIINIPGAEVYAVVPPDLVQKFGIDSLITVATTGEFFTEEQLKNAELLLSGNGEETISETASLLKESILLTGSPNLAPTATKNSGETDLPHGSTESDNSSKITAKGILYLGKSDNNDKNPWEFNNAVEDKHVLTEIDTTKSHEKRTFIDPKGLKELSVEPEHKLEEEKDENKNYYEIDENKRLLKDKIRNMVINKYANIGEEQGNDSNNKKSPANVSKKCDNVLNFSKRNFFGPSCPKPSSKISIISEEIVDSTKLRKLKCLHSSNVTLTPVTINSVIKPKKTDDPNDIVQTDRVSVIKKDENTQNVSLHPTIDLNGETSHEFTSEDFVLQPHNSMSKDADDVLTLISHNVTNGTCENLLEEQLDQREKEPTFVCNEKFMDVKNIVVQTENNEINLSPVDINEHDNAEKDNINNFKNNCKESTVTNTETLPNLNLIVTTAKSKLCVQGVEKPGGEQNNQESENIPTAIKTYRKSKRLNQSVKQNVNTKSTNEVVYPTHEVGTREINAVVSSEECKYEEFCICEDFGKLNFYDSDIAYEHIHFWKGESMTVDPELIFSLYDDEYCYPRAEVGFLFPNVHTEEISDEICVNYCWNRYLCKETVNMRNEISGCESLSGQRNISNGKDITKKLGKQNCEHIDDARESKINEVKKKNSKVNNIEDQQTLFNNIHEGKVNVSPRDILTKCVTKRKSCSSDEVHSTSEDSKTKTKEQGGVLVVSSGCELNLDKSKTSTVDQTEKIERKPTNSDESLIPVGKNQNMIISENIQNPSNYSVGASLSAKPTEPLEKPKARRGRPPKNKNVLPGSAGEPTQETDNNRASIDITTDNDLDLNTSSVCVKETTEETNTTAAASVVSPACELNRNKSKTCVVDQTEKTERRATDSDASSMPVAKDQNMIISENIQNPSYFSVDASPSVKPTEPLKKPKARRGRPPKNKNVLPVSASEPTQETENSRASIDITTDNDLDLNTSSVCVKETTEETNSTAAASVVSPGYEVNLDKSKTCVFDQTEKIEKKATNSDASLIPVDKDNNIIILENIQNPSNYSVDASPSVKPTETLEKPKARRGRPPKNKNLLPGSASEPTQETENSRASIDITTDNDLDLNTSSVCVKETTEETNSTAEASANFEQGVQKRKSISSDLSTTFTPPPAKITEVIEKPKARRGRPPKNYKSALSISASESKEDSKNTTGIIDISTDNDIDLNKSNVSVVEETTGIQNTKLNNSEASSVSLDNSHNLSITENQTVQIEKPKAKRGRPRKYPITTQLSTSVDIKTPGEADDFETLRVSKPIIKRCYRGKTASSTTYTDGVGNTSCEISKSINNSDERSNDGNESTEEPIGGKKRRSSHIALLMSDDEINDSEIPSQVSTKRLTRNVSIQSTSARDGDLDETSEHTENNNVQCGVCNEYIKSDDWLKHIARAHDYLAWKEGMPPLDLDDEFEVKMHLQNILKDVEVLVCNICGLKRKYVAAYLKHKNVCEPSDLDESVPIYDSHEESNTSLNCSKIDINLRDNEEIVQCGVCNIEVKGIDWIHHIGREHNYLGWAEGDTPININDAVEVQRYLMSLVKKIGGLTCYKCGLVRKYAKFYWQHVETCEAENKFAVETGTLLREYTGDKVQCAVCLEEVIPKEWKRHAMNKHYNIAWVVGDTSIDIKNFYAVERYLKEYKNKRNNKLICRVCGTSKVSCCGFYAHVITCGKTEEECENFKETCDICNKKYLCIYKSQHMTMHREQELAKERKLKKLTMNKEEPVESVETSSETPSRRKAAEKAKSVIAKYKDELSNERKDSDAASGDSSDSDVSVKLEQYSDHDSDDTDEMSSLSEEEEDVENKRKRPTESSAPVITRIPFPVKNVKSYIDESYEDFCENNLTNEKLFPEWSRCEYEEVSDDQIDKYMPALTESCKINVAYDGWSTLARFESAKKNDIVRLFVGASVQCVSWVPTREAHEARNYLSVACHSAADCPRYNCDEVPQHSNLMQIWDFGDMEGFKPRLVFGLAHDYGTIWAMDWCPSGARDKLDNDEDKIQTQLRLGLLAIACSNGSAYIFCIPYPSMITVKDKLFYKIKPVAELRFLSEGGHDRKYQATSLRWSYEKGHNTIMVGYSDGTVAYFDLGNDSPLLVSKEDGVKIIHPYYDERSHNSCVTGVDMFSCGTSGGAGAVCSGSASGARVSQGARATSLLSTLACAGVFFLPHWPSAVLTAVNSKVNQTVNELEWQCVGGRRVGGVRARAACACCGALAAAAEPLLRVLRAHPAHHDINKYVAGIIQMSHIAQKRKQTNDELAMKLEPLTYDDAVKKYGIQFHLLSKKNKNEQQKASAMPMTHYPERFPLAEITSMAFCPTAKHHKKLAIATHAGVIFLINVV